MKQERQRIILELIRNKDIYTQEELAIALKNAGFIATQATISRDIRELRLTKVATPAGQKYAIPTSQDISKDALARVFRDGLISVDHAGNMLVLRTISGMADVVALAIDSKNYPEILGTVAGDDVVMCVIKSESQAAALVEKLKI
ncbi:MAG: arginine repressor [Defluviitaleaceae bacterium]|nr:arginine repressor [Defluviitaleaceae bacterium]